MSDPRLQRVRAYLALAKAELDEIEGERPKIQLHDGSEPQPVLMVCDLDEPPSRPAA